MIQPLREYQQNAVVGVIKHWEGGTRCVLLVAPTGAGKTRLAEEFVYRELAAGGSVLFIVHRRELLRQASSRLEKRFGKLEVGIVAPGEDAQPFAKIQVGTVQTLLARGIRPDVSLVIFDEAHHYAASDWSDLVQHYGTARLLGLTATPERQDGRPLGDLFSGMVVAAKYTELVRDGFLVPCACYQPPASMGGDLAQDPLAAYQRYAENSRTFGFAASVALAHELAERFTAAGYPSACIHAQTPRRERDEIVDRFSAGELRAIWNCNTMTEGVDVPAARCVILARSFRHVGSYLQAAGRVLRPHPDKPHAILIDLTGATLAHGMPTEDREYSLDGEGIKRTSLAPLRNCAECGATVLSAVRVCPECGYEAPAQEKPDPKIYDLELKAVFAGADTPSDAKGREYRRLRQVAKDKGWSLGWVVREYKKLFNEDPVMVDVGEEEQREELARLRALAAEKGWKPGFAGVRFKTMFGKWPPRGW